MPSADIQAASSIAALLIDVDGNVVSKEKGITGPTIEAARRVQERGLVFTIVSERPARCLRMLVEPLGLKLPMAAFNGGVIVLPDLSVLDERPLPDYLLPALIETIEAQGLALWLYTAADGCIRAGQTPVGELGASTFRV